MKTKLTYALLTAFAATSLVYCSGTDNNNDDDGSGPVGSTTGSGGSGGGATTGSGGDSSTGGGSQGGGGINFTSGTGGDGGSCVDLVVEGESQILPADIIFIIDKSGSMSEEINGVEQNINVNFAQVLAQSNLDYRIIMLTAHGDNTSISDLEVCIGPPLSGTTNCAGPPVNVPGQFYHYSVEVQSSDSLCKILNTFYGNEPDEFNLAPGGWQQWLRPEAVKVFVEVSDDDSFCTWNGNTFNDGNSISQGQQMAVDFDKALLALSPLHFGTQANRNYIWYSLIGLQAKNPSMPLEPWEPFDPVTLDECTPGAVASATGYQWLSKGTQGLRFPLCDPGGYNVMFQDIADGVEAGTKVSCELALPEPPMGQDLDLNTLTVIYTPMGTGTPVDLTKVDGLGLCGPNNFYIENQLIKICPQSCTTIENDPSAKVEIKIACGGDVN